MLRDKWSRFTDSGSEGFNHASAAIEHAWAGGWILAAVVLLALAAVAEWLSEGPERWRKGKETERRRLDEAANQRARGKVAGQ
jgi:hypothetical protein